MLEFERVDATLQPGKFVSMLLLVASKAMTLSHGRRAKQQLLRVGSAPLEAQMQGLTVREGLAYDCLTRQHLKNGVQINLLRWALRLGAEHDRLSSEPKAVLRVAKDLTFEDIKCRSGGRGLSFRLCGKRTEVYLLEGRLETAESPGPGPLRKYVVKICWQDRSKLGREVEVLAHMQRVDPSSGDKVLPDAVRKLLPTVVTSGLAQIDQWDSVGRLIEALGEHEEMSVDPTTSLGDEVKVLYGAHHFPYLIIYDAEYFDLRTLEPRHYLAALSDAVCALSFCWKRLGFMHRDISETNLHAAFNADGPRWEDLCGPAKSPG